MSPRRLELAFYAGVLLVCCALAQAYFPTQPDAARELEVATGLGAGLAALLAVLPGPSSRRWVRWGVRLLLAPAAGLGAIGLLFMIASSLALLLIVSPTLGALATVGPPLVVLVGLVRWRRGTLSARALRLTTGALLGALALLNMPVCAWLWAPPSASTCEAPVRPGVVERLTPQALPDALAQPYSLLWIPERKTLAASFKMAGNLTIWAWDDPTANRLVLVQPETGQLTEVDRTGDALPQYMAWDPEREELAISRLGFEDHHVDLITLAGDRPAVRHSVEVDLAAHAVLRDEEKDELVLFGHFRQVRTLRWDNLFERRRFTIHNTLFDPGLLVTHAAAIPGTTRAAVSMFGHGVVELDWRTFETRTATVPFGAGELIVEPRGGRIYQADMVFGGVNVVDTERFELVRRLELDYSPRALAADPERDLLMIADWLGGRVEAWRLSTLEPLGVDVAVGPYVRTLAYDPARGALFAASKCGVYEVDAEAAFHRPANPSDR